MSSVSLIKQLDSCDPSISSCTKRLDHEQLSVGGWKESSDRVSQLQVSQTLESDVVGPSAS